MDLGYVRRIPNRETISNQNRRLASNFSSRPHTNDRPPQDTRAPGLIYPQHPAVVARHVDQDSHDTLRRHQLLDLLRPFDQAQVTTVEILLLTEIERLLDPIDPVEVEMINRTVTAVFVLVDYGERGTGHRICDTQTVADFADQRRFPRSHLPAQRNDRAALQRIENFSCRIVKVSQSVYKTAQGQKYKLFPVFHSTSRFSSSSAE